MKNLNKGFSILYLVIIISIILSLWVVVLNKQKFFNLMVEQTHIKNMLLKNISSKYSLSTNKLLSDNNDWWWFNPSISCPVSISYISWWISQWTGNSQAYFNNSLWEYICSWSLMWNNLNLFYTWSYQLFGSWTLWTENFSISKVGSDFVWNLISWDTIKFAVTWLSNIDWNKNSDDYKATSTWSFYYPNWWFDNDIDARILLFWYIPRSFDFFNIFWSNTQINNFIDSNTNNDDIIFKKVLQTNTWAIYLDVDDDVNLKIVEFDKKLYDEKKYLKVVNQINVEKAWWIYSWFLQKDYSFSPEQNSDTLYFDFATKDYWIFIKTWTWVISDYISYNLKIYDELGNWVYISPIKDDWNTIEYLWYDIIENNWQYIPYLSKFFRLK